jgi:predicted ArsR family transcriptional regulator
MGKLAHALDVRTTDVCEHLLVVGQLERPTRTRILTAVATAPEPITTRALAEEIGMHRNGVRSHLLRLREEGLVESRRVVPGPGRPRDAWTLTAQGRDVLGDGEANAELARWLAEVIATRPELLADVEAAGRRVGERLVAEDPQRDVTTALLQAFATLGFAPRREEGPGPGDLTLQLCHCPYRVAAASAGDVVCRLHRGITEGVLTRADPAARLTHFEPRDPFAAGCVVRVVRTPS